MDLEVFLPAVLLNPLKNEWNVALAVAYGLATVTTIALATICWKY